MDNNPSSKKRAPFLLLPKLRSIQEKENYISEENINMLSKETGIPAIKIYEAITFYSFLSTEKKGKYVIRVCDSPSCFVNDSTNVIRIIKEIIGISPGETSEDGKFTLETTQCIGCCNEGPAMLINKEVHTRLDENKIREIIQNLR